MILNKRLILILAGLFVFSAACGDDDGTISRPDGSTGPDSSTLRPDGSTGGGDGGGDGSAPTMNIVEIASGNPDFSMLVAAVTKAELATTLSGTGPFTVFAPNNDAFDASGIDMDAIENTLTKEQLTTILTYHVVSGNVASSAVPDNAPSLSEVEYTDSGETRSVPLTLLFDTSSGVAINGGSGSDPENLGANVVTPDLPASNGTIHVIDEVLMPLSIAEIATVGGFTELVAAVGASDDIPGPIAGSNTPVLDALNKADLAPLTVFAPTDAAFSSASLPTDGAGILGVLGAHVIADTLPILAANLPTDTMTEVDTLTAKLTFDSSVPSVTLAGGNTANITDTDFGATNGVVHVIDAVLQAP